MASLASTSHPVTDHGATGDRPAPKAPSSKKTTVAKSKKTFHSPEHPKYSVMIADAITSMKQRGGSSRQAILKFITSHYKVEPEINKVNSRVKVALKTGVKSGALKQSKGTGAAGSFRLGDKKGSEKTKKIRPTSIAKACKSPAKKSKTAIRKPKSPAKKTAAKKSKAAKSPAKKQKISVKKMVKTPLKKPKTKSSAKKGAAKPKKHAKKDTRKC